MLPEWGGVESDEVRRGISLEPARSTATPGDRFLNRGMLIVFVLYGAFAVTFAYFQVKGDGLSYFTLLRRFFGEHPGYTVAYQFGSDVWNTPFFLVGKALSAIFGAEPHTFHVTFEEISITFASNAAFVLTLYLGWRILRELDLPRGAAILFLTAFGSPLFYAAIFDPSGKHAVDTLVLTAGVFAFLRCDATGRWVPALALGALGGWAVNIRFVNASFFVVLVVALLLKGRATQFGAATLAGGVVAPAILVLPALRGIHYFRPHYFLTDGARPLASSSRGLLLADATGGTTNPLHAVRPSIPFDMLFSEHRGLFTWTPLTALATLGFLVATALSFRRGSRSLPFVVLLVAAIALICSHVFWYQWDGGFAFSQRFLTGLFPILLIGVAEVVRHLRWAAYPLLVAGAAFAIAVAFVHNVGYDGVSERDGISTVVHAGIQGRRDLRLQVQNDAEARWGYLWALLHGNDPAHVHGP